MKPLILVLFGAAAPDGCIEFPTADDTADESIDIEAVGGDCAEGVAVLPEEAWTIEVVAVGVEHIGGNEYTTASAPVVTWEQEGTTVYAVCPQIPDVTWGHFTVYYTL